MASSPNLRIGQLAERAGVNPKTIRFYESIGVLPEPARSDSGYRLYSASDAERLQFIRRAKTLGLSLQEIRDILTVRESGSFPCDYVHEIAERRAAELEQKVDELVRLRDELVELASTTTEVVRVNASDRGICPAIEARVPAVSS